MPSIGQNVRRLREEAGFVRQLEFAKALDLPTSRVSELETDRYALPDTETLIRVAKVIGCSLDDILAGVDPGYDAVMSAWHEVLTSVREFAQESLARLERQPPSAKRDAEMQRLRGVAHADLQFIRRRIDEDERAEFVNAWRGSSPMGRKLALIVLAHLQETGSQTTAAVESIGPAAQG